MRQALKKAALVMACAAGMAATMQVEAANWLMLQGTERSSAAGRAKVWGFLQPTYESMKGSTLQAGPWTGGPAQFNNQPPHLTTSKGFGIRRARIGVRGQGFPLDPKVNYFFLVEYGSNGITWPGGGGGAAKIDHASVTLNHIPGARVRVGLFKTPMSEEVYQGIHVFDYINFTSFGFQQLLERFFDGDGSDSPAGGNANLPNGPIGAVRDQGVQVFDSFKTGDWETSYALMVGNGNGIARGDHDSNLDNYVYFSTEKVYAGRGPRAQSLKFYAWSINGKRHFASDAANPAIDAIGKGTYDRKRSGIGMTYRKGKYRAAAEVLRADGMIFTGTDGGAVASSPNTGLATAGPNPVAGTLTSGFNMAPEEKADAYYVHFGYAVTRQLELDIRYDTMNRSTVNTASERKFTTTTLGAQWFFNLKTRLVINYEIRNAEAPNLPSTATPNLILGGMDDRFAIQVTSIF
jgi:hypothetical protein